MEIGPYPPWYPSDIKFKGFACGTATNLSCQKNAEKKAWFNRLCEDHTTQKLLLETLVLQVMKI